MTVITEKPDGEKDTTVTQTTDIVAVTKDDKDVVSSSQSSKVTGSVNKVTIAVLGGIDFKSKLPVYGASVSRPLLGPITMGVFGLTNGTAGVSLGLEF